MIWQRCGTMGRPRGRIFFFGLPKGEIFSRTPPLPLRGSCDGEPPNRPMGAWGSRGGEVLRCPNVLSPRCQSNALATATAGVGPVKFWGDVLLSPL